MRKLRIASQILFIVLFFIHFFFLNSLPLAYRVPSQTFLRLNPLSALATLIASHGIIWQFCIGAGIVALGTIIAGRFFCGFICPLGAVIDFSDRFITNKMYSKSRKPPHWLKHLKYIILFSLLTASIFKVAFFLLLDPISITTRFSALVLNPLFKIVVTDIKELLVVAGVEPLSITTIKQPLYYGIDATLFLMALILGLGFFDRRFWCQYICPSGALLGLLSRFSLFRRSVKQSCKCCKICSVKCPTTAINPQNPKITSTAECILCGICTSIKPDCNSFTFNNTSFSKEISPPDIHRRHISIGILSGLALATLARANAISKRSNDGRLIRPPGAIPEKLFLGRCLACGQCMKSCPTNAIQPCTFKDGIHQIYTPKIVPKIGGCEEKCYMCGHVCPTGALRPLSYEQKNFAKIGTAVIDRHRCLAWEQNKECLVCDEVCPYNAIEARTVQTATGPFTVPIVNEGLCLGCGLCEQHCPITNQAAIIVYNFGENRRTFGDYVTKFQKENIIRLRNQASVSKQNSIIPSDTLQSHTVDNTIQEGF